MRTIAVPPTFATSADPSAPASPATNAEPATSTSTRLAQATSRRQSPCSRTLTLTRMPSSSCVGWVCDLCREGCAPGNFVYRCVRCMFDVYPLCPMLPQTIRSHAQPEHDLCMVPAGQGDCCSACNGGLDVWQYRCGFCRLKLHIACASDAAIGGGEQHAMLLRLLPRRRSAVLRVTLSTDTTGRLDRSGHAHNHQRTQYDRSATNVCDLCRSKMAGLTGYRCKQGCDFDIHEACAKHFDETLSFFAHPWHTLKLSRIPSDSKISWFCDLCREACPKGNLVYRCIDCVVDVHPLCTMLPQTIRSPIHDDHDLRMVPGWGKCNACRKDLPVWRYVCSCLPFKLHIGCVSDAPNNSNPGQSNATGGRASGSHAGKSNTAAAHTTTKAQGSSASQTTGSGNSHSNSVRKFLLDPKLRLAINAANGRGRWGRGRGGGSGFDHPAKHAPHENFPDITLPEMTCVTVSNDERALILFTNKLEGFWKTSCYHLEVDAPKKTMASTLRHFADPHLLLQTQYNNSATHVCDICRSKMAGLTGYRCSACDFNIHEACANYFKETVSFAHPWHTLTLSRIPTSNVGWVCDLCKEACPPGNLVYRCIDCIFDVHPLCTMLPQTIRSPLHPQHDLRMVPSSGRCKACREDLPVWHYVCSCLFRVHIACVSGGAPGQSNTDAGHASGGACAGKSSATTTVTAASTAVVATTEAQGSSARQTASSGKSRGSSVAKFLLKTSFHLAISAATGGMASPAHSNLPALSPSSPAADAAPPRRAPPGSLDSHPPGRRHPLPSRRALPSPARPPSTPSRRSLPMSFRGGRGRWGRGRGGGSGFDHPAKHAPHENFPDITLPEMTCVTASNEERALILFTNKLEGFWKTSCYHLELDAPKKKNVDREIERFSDRKRKTQAKREALVSYLKLTPSNFPAELVQGSRRGQDGVKVEKEGDDEDEEEEEEAQEEEESSDDDYTQNVEFDDDDDDWNQEEEARLNVLDLSNPQHLRVELDRAMCGCAGADGKVVMK
ncbi:hypothetical protein U9M48_015858, partial [Paspalum notatum var. saurae]